MEANVRDPWNPGEQFVPECPLCSGKLRRDSAGAQALEWGIGLAETLEGVDTFWMSAMATDAALRSANLTEKDVDGIRDYRATLQHDLDSHPPFGDPMFGESDEEGEANEEGEADPDGVGEGEPKAGDLGPVDDIPTTRNDNRLILQTDVHGESEGRPVPILDSKKQCCIKNFAYPFMASTKSTEFENAPPQQNLWVNSGSGSSPSV